MYESHVWISLSGYYLVIEKQSWQKLHKTSWGLTQYSCRQMYAYPDIRHLATNTSNLAQFTAETLDIKYLKCMSRDVR